MHSIVFPGGVWPVLLTLNTNDNKVDVNALFE